MAWNRFLLVLLFPLSSCYSFQDASVNPNLSTATVHFFENRAQLVNPNYSQLFTEALKDKILGETSLDLVTSSADVEFKGSITKYEILPIAAQAGETAALNRLTINVEVECVNHLEEKENWTSRFSRYADFARETNFADVEDGLVTEVNEQLVDDIFRKAFVNW